MQCQPKGWQRWFPHGRAECLWKEFLLAQLKLCQTTFSWAFRKGIVVYPVFVVVVFFPSQIRCLLDMLINLSNVTRVVFKQVEMLNHFSVDINFLVQINTVPVLVILFWSAYKWLALMLSGYTVKTMFTEYGNLSRVKIVLQIYHAISVISSIKAN